MASKLLLLLAIFAMENGESLSHGGDDLEETDVLLREMRMLMEKVEAEQKSGQARRLVNLGPLKIPNSTSKADVLGCSLDVFGVVASVITGGFSFISSLELCEKAMNNTPGNDALRFCAAEVTEVVSFLASATSASLGIVESCAGNFQQTYKCAEKALDLSSAVTGVASGITKISGGCKLQDGSHPPVAGSSAVEPLSCTFNIIGILRNLFSSGSNILATTSTCGNDPTMCVAKISGAVAGLAGLARTTMRSIESCGAPTVITNACATEYAGLIADLASTSQAAARVSTECKAEALSGRTLSPVSPDARRKLMSRVPTIRTKLTQTQRLFAVDKAERRKTAMTETRMHHSTLNMVMMLGTTGAVAALGGLLVGVRIGKRAMGETRMASIDSCDVAEE